MIGRTKTICLMLAAVSAASPVAAEQGGFLRFLLAEPQPVAARDPHWSYTLQRYLEQPASQPPAGATVAAKSTVTGSLPRSRATAVAVTSHDHRVTGDPHAAARAPNESITGPSHKLAGLASFYWQPQMTANGEVFDPRQLTAAHNTLPFGTRVRVTDVRTGRSVVVRINDRGPYKPGRIIDLSQAAAQSIGMASVGITPVKLEVMGR